MVARRIPLLALVLAASVLAFAHAEAGSEPLRTVNSTNDPGVGTCDKSECTLREALEEIGEIGLIDFFIDSEPNCVGIVCTITLDGSAGLLPEIPAGVTIDTTSQGDTGNGPPIIIDGSNLGPQSPALRTGGDGITIIGLEIRDFSGSGITDETGGSGGHTIENSVFTGLGANGRGAIELIGSGNVVANVTVSGNNANGIDMNFLTSGDNSVADSEFTNNGGDAIRAAGTDVTITGNTFDGNQVGVTYSDVDADPADFSLTDNTMVNHALEGASVDANGASIINNTITGNGTDVNNFSVGFSFSGSNALIVDNLIEDNLQDGARVFGSGIVFAGNSVSRNATDGATVGGDSEISDNTIMDNGGNGVKLSPLNGTELIDNDISSNGAHGIFVEAVEISEPGNTIGAFIGGPGAANEIHDNGGAGVYLEDVGFSRQGFADTFPPSAVSITSNSITGNGGLGIDLAPEGVTANDGDDDDDGPNTLLNFPVLSGADGQAVSGTACDGCEIEIYIAAPDPSGHGEGQEFLSLATARDDGTFSAPICATGLATGTPLTATATDQDGNTSEFSLNFELPQPVAAACQNPTPTPTPTPDPTGTMTPAPSETAEPTATPTFTPGPTGTPGAKLLQGDVQCDADVDSVDALQQLRDVAGLSTFQEDGCPQIGAAGAIFGDVDCDGDVDSVDALKVLRHVAALSVTQTEPCTDIGDPL